jgi:hypothetical protein
VDLYARVRRAVQVDGMSIRNASREFGLSRKTIRKMMGFSIPPVMSAGSRSPGRSWVRGWGSLTRSWKMTSRSRRNSGTQQG